ncbi:unnamed protein product [Arctia plantaginis]|uniref:Uncharacterized protein n=1 Tax=Arctia plantaginis TaxID=874455 RepID=A0A8S1ANS7_ARCPL|nr:unnamed protein product [Arctia plantaginis]
MLFGYNWKQLGFDFNGVQYVNDTAKQWNPDGIYFEEELDDKDQFFIQYNNVPVGFEVHKKRMFITVPRRRFGIPSTLNYVDITAESTRSPLLKPYPDVDSVISFVSVYRPRVDVCGRLWLVDTGLLEVPNSRVQIKQPEVIVFDLATDKEIVRYQFKQSDLFNGTTSGFISITVDVTRTNCDNAYAYINDLATGGLVVFSLKERDSWRFSHPSFNYDPASIFNLGEYTINWRDGIFSIALSDPDSRGIRTAYYHPFISAQEFSITTDILKNKNGDFENNFKLLGVRGLLSQSASHVYHGPTRTLLFANIAQNGILCWNVDKSLTQTALAAHNQQWLAYITDIKVSGDYVYVLVNQMHNFIYSRLDPSVYNFFVLGAKVTDLIKGTVCDNNKKPTHAQKPLADNANGFSFYNNHGNKAPIA